MKRFPLLATAALLVVPMAAAHGDIIFAGTVTIGGTGLGAVNTVLTIQNNPSEQGCVIPTNNGAGQFIGALSGNSCMTGSNDAKTGASQTQTRSLLDVGVLSGAAFGIVFNADQPAGGPISLDNLVAYFMNTAGQTMMATLSCGIACNFASTQQGIGKSGELFVLNGTQAAALQTFITSSGGAGNVFVGLGAAAGGTPGFGAAGGPETFFVFSTAPGGVPFSIAPEPSTMVLAATGFLGMAVIARRRRRI